LHEASYTDLAVFSAAQAHFARLLGDLSCSDSLASTHAEVEDRIQTEGLELMRLLFQAHLDHRADLEAQAPAVSAAPGTRVRASSRGLMSVFGPVRVPRLAYSRPGHPAHHPADAALNLPPDLYSFGVRARTAESAACVSFDEAVDHLARHTGARLHKRQAEELCQRAARDFDAFYLERQRQARAADPTTTGALLVLSVDSKGVVMHTQDLRPETRQAARRRRQKMSKRLSVGEKRQAKRMATVAAVYTSAPCVRGPEHVVRELNGVQAVEARRPACQDKRVWASLEQEPSQVIAQVFAEARHRDPDGQKRWVVVVDGNKTQMKLIQEQAREAGVEVTVVLDIIHVIEYLWKAAYALHGDGSAQVQAWVSQRLLRVLEGKSASVAGGIRRAATRRALRGHRRKQADKSADYLLRYGPYLRYDTYLAQGLPIASGVIEGACRHLVKDRMELTGARWRLASAEAVLKVRSLRSSGDFAQYWDFHQTCELTRNHVSHTAA
jgi:hypothetical protein